MNYTLVSPSDFTEEQNKFVATVKDSVKLIFTESLCGVKDIHSRFITSTDRFANFVGLACGEDMAGRLDCEMPCDSVVQFAQDFVNEDRELFSYTEGDRKKSVLNIIEYTVGLEALLVDKQPIKHEPSKSILGLIGIAYRIDLSYFFSLMPNYLREFGAIGSIESVNSAFKIDSISLTEYEHEVAFLMAMNWSAKQIAHFMNKYRPLATSRTADTIYKCRDRICNKFDCDSRNFREKLIEMGLHKKMPDSFFKRLIGNRSLN